jgi:hypothetical protein
VDGPGGGGSKEDEDYWLEREREQRIERSGLKLLSKPRPTQGCRVNRRWAESHLKKKLTRFTVSAI